MSKRDHEPRDPGLKSEADLPAADTAPEVEWEGGESAIADEAAQAVAEAEDRLLRLAAEFDNYRKRTAREKTEAFDRGASALMVRLLDVLDDMDRLAGSESSLVSPDTFRDAFDLIQKKLRKELEAAGLERIDSTGAVFDPTMHEAVAAIVPDDPAQEHHVKATFQTGYRFKGAVVRPARVQVYSSHGVA